MPGIQGLAKLSRFRRPLVALAGTGAVLSGLAGWWNAFSTVRTATTSPGANSAAAAASAPASPLSVVVMPLANQTGDAQRAYIADGLTSSVTADLSRIQDAYVVPATTAFAYRDKGLTVQQLGQTLGVRYVLGGSVISGGAKLRITAQLTDARSGAQVWSRRFDGEMADVMALQDQVTKEMASTTGNAMVVNAARQSEKQRGNPNAMDLRLRARAIALQAQSRDGLERQQALLREALAIEPGNVSTQVDLAKTLWVLASNWERSDRKRDLRDRHWTEARQLASAASAAEPDNVGACRLMGNFAQLDGELEVARRVLERCLAVSPKAPSILSDLALTYIYDGTEGARKAVSLLQQVAEIEGAHTNEATLMNLGEALFTAGDSAHAIEPLQMALRLNPLFDEANVYLAMAYADLGDTTHLDEIKGRLNAAKAAAIEPQGFGFKRFEKNNSVDTAGYRALRDTRFVPLWRKAGLPP